MKKNRNFWWILLVIVLIPIVAIVAISCGDFSMIWDIFRKDESKKK